MCRSFLLAAGLAAAGSIDGDEVSRLREQAATPQAPAALARLVELAVVAGDAQTACAATDALPSFGTSGDLALDRVLHYAVRLDARARALELCAARRHPEDRGLFVELAASNAPTSLRLRAIELLAVDREALPLLVPLLDSGDASVQARALRILGEARIGGALERARELLAPNSRGETLQKITAIDVLRVDGDPDSIRRLIEVTGRELGDVRDFAFKSLLVMDRGAVLLLLLPMLEPASPAPDALVALEIVAHVDAGALPELRDAVRGALDHRDPSVQAAAARTAVALRDREALPRLKRETASLDPMVAVAAIEARTELERDDPVWRETLRRLLRSTRVPLRLAAVRSLARITDEQTVPLLIALLNDDEWRVREAAVEGLGALRSPAAIEPLLARLEKERLRVRGAVVRALRRTSGMPFRDCARDWRRWWSDVEATFAVPPLEQVEAMETRLARNAEHGPTRASFYGLPVDSDHLALVVDVSGSMNEIDPAQRSATQLEPTARGSIPTKLEVAKVEIERLLERLPDGAAVNLLFFSGAVERWQLGLVNLHSSGAARASAFVRERRAGGGTNLFDALDEALADPQVDTIYLLSDGHPTAGKIVDPTLLRAEIRRRNVARNVRIHVVALGRGSPLLHHLAEDSGGALVQR